jgi:hypothetical protein
MCRGKSQISPLIAWINDFFHLFLVFCYFSNRCPCRFLIVVSFCYLVSKRLSKVAGKSECIVPYMALCTLFSREFSTCPKKHFFKHKREKYFLLNTPKRRSLLVLGKHPLVLWGKVKTFQEFQVFENMPKSRKARLPGNPNSSKKGHFYVFLLTFWLTQSVKTVPCRTPKTGRGSIFRFSGFLSPPIWVILK